MADVDIVRAVDGAELVKSEQIGGHTFVIVWQGGTTFTVYSTGTGSPHTWHEIDVFTVYDDEGFPVGGNEAAKHMAMHFEQVREVIFDE